MAKKNSVLTIKEFRSKYSIKKETLKFLHQMEVVIVIEDNVYFNKREFEQSMYDKGTIFRYTFSDSWKEDLDFYKKMTQNTSKVKYYSKKEIEELNKKLKGE